MSRNTKRKLEDFDPNKSDSDDGDYDNRVATASSRSRGKKQSHAHTHSHKPQKRRRQNYNDSDDDIVDDDDDEISEEEDSFDGSDGEESPKVNPSTGRRQRSAAKKQVNYEEPSEDEIRDSDSDNSTSPPAKRSRPVDSYIVKLHISPHKMRTLRTRKPGGKRDSTPEVPTSAGTRRSSRISHTSEDPLIELTDSGKHTIVVRPGSRQTSEEPARRSTRAGKSVKGPAKYPSAIMEASQEDSGSRGQAVEPGPGDTLDELQMEDVEMKTEDRKDDDAADPADEVIPSSDAEDDDRSNRDDDGAAAGDDDDDDDEPISRRPGRSLRQRGTAETPPLARRSLRQKKAVGEPSSDFEPEAEEEAEENVSDDDDDDVQRPGKRKAKSDDSDSGGNGRRSGRLANRRAKSQARSESEDGELDLDEIADEAASLAEDRRRNKRPRRGRRAEEIAYEPALRTRSNRPDYRVFRPELLAQMDEEENAEPPPPSQTRGGRKPGAPFRSLFSTLGPFGGGGGGLPVFGGPGGNAAAGGADSDSSDDDMIRRPSAALGGSLGMTPTQGQVPFGMAPQTHNADPAQATSGGPANFGKVKDRKALADADPLGVDPTVDFEAVGGLGDHIDRLKEMVALPLLYPEVFMRMHITPPRGVLFHGPPGTGKTLLARALASSVSAHGKKVTFYMRKGADALSKWVGEAERQLRLLFDEARKNQPSIIFFDEIDGLAPVRSSKQEQIHASIVATLLALMDGMDGRGQVIVIGATNRPDSVDPALRRPGRFDREFYFPLPNKDARRAIIDIHTKGWEPALKPQFKDQLADLTKGYGGADLRALCTEAALNAVQGTFPQIYASNKKLLIDPSQIKVLAKDFMISVNKIVPSSERSASSGSAPLKKSIEPLLRQSLKEIQAMLQDIMPKSKKRTALEEAEYDDREDEFGLEKETLQREFEGSRVFRPRLLITGSPGMGQQYLGAALLSKFEGMYVANLDFANIFKDSTRSVEAAIVQMFEEVKRHKPSVIYITNVDIWYQCLQETAIRTFTGLLKSLPPTDPVLLLGIMDSAEPNKLNAAMMSDLFSYSRTNMYMLKRPDVAARQEFFKNVVELIQKPPTEFPDPENRAKRQLPVLPEAPVVEDKPKELSKAELKAQKKHDRYTINRLKMFLQQIMDYIKKAYRRFRSPPIEERHFAYLFDEQDPDMLTTDLGEDEAQQRMYRPYKIDHDKDGVNGLREVATGKFFYNLEIVTIEQRLSNGYYKRSKDFLADIKRLAKDAKTLGDPDRMIKAKELITNVEVDVANLDNDTALRDECEAVYQREKTREKLQKEAAERNAEHEGGPVLRPLPSNVTLNDLSSTDPSTGPVRLEPEVPAPRTVPPMPYTPQRSELSNGYSHSNGSAGRRSGEDIEMSDSQDTSGHSHPEQSQAQYSTPGLATQTQKSQHSSIMQMAPGSQARDYVNSASTTTSGQKTGEHSDHSKRSSGQHTGTTHSSNGVYSIVPDFSAAGDAGGSHLPDTQEQLSGSQGTPHSSPDVLQPSYHVMGPPLHHPPHHSQQQTSRQLSSDTAGPTASNTDHRADIGAILNPTTQSHPASDNAPKTSTTANSATGKSISLIPADAGVIARFSQDLASRSSGLSVEQLEQVNAALMRAIWEHRRDWNRARVMQQVVDAFNATLEDIEAVQDVLKPSQEEDDDDASHHHPRVVYLNEAAASRRPPPETRLPETMRYDASAAQPAVLQSAPERDLGSWR